MKFTREGGRKFVRAFVNTIFGIDAFFSDVWGNLAQGLKWLTGNSSCYYARRLLWVAFLWMGIAVPLGNFVERDYFSGVMGLLSDAFLLWVRFPQRLLDIVRRLERFFEEEPSTTLPIFPHEAMDVLLWRLLGMLFGLSSLVVLDWRGLGWLSLGVGLYFATSGVGGGKSLVKRVVEKLREKLASPVPVGAGA